MKNIYKISMASILLGSVACQQPENNSENKECSPVVPGPLKFTEVTADLFGGAQPVGKNVTVADINGDGFPDFVASAGDNESGTFKVWLNNKGQSFTDFTTESGLAVQAASFIVFGDIDNDGDQDALAVVYNTVDDSSDYMTNIFINDGQGHFKVVEGQKFGSAAEANISAVMTDFDHDGYLDIFLANHYGRYGYLNTAKADKLFHNNQDGTFEEVTDGANMKLSGFSAAQMSKGLNPKPSWGASACDLNDDGWDEILVSTYGRQFNDLWRNDIARSGVFVYDGINNGVAADDNMDYSDNLFYICYCSAHADEAACANAKSIDPAYCTGSTDNWYVGSDDQNYRLGGNSSNFLCGDLDGDGDIDLVSLELRHEHIGRSSDATEILLNEGWPEKPFRRPGNEVTGLTREHKGDNYFNEGDLAGVLADFDGDGRLDILVASSDYPDTWSLLWQQQTDGTFKEVADEVGIRQARAHGVAIFDYDHDGDYDVIMGTSLMRWEKDDEPTPPEKEYLHIFRNDSISNKIILQLRGKGQNGSNAEGIGAKVVVNVAGKEIVRQKQGPYGLTGIQNDNTMIIGLGDQCAVDSVTVRWPNSEDSSVTYDLPQKAVSTLYRLDENGAVETIEY